MAGLARPERKAPMKEYNDQITEMDPRRELPSMVRYLSADRLAGIIEEAQNGDTRELFALYRDVISNDNQVRSESPSSAIPSPSFPLRRATSPTSMRPRSAAKCWIIPPSRMRNPG